MNENQLNLIRTLIKKDRDYHTNVAQRKHAFHEDRCIEIQDIDNDIIELKNLELLEIIQVSENRYRAFLYSSNPYNITYSDEDE